MIKILSEMINWSSHVSARQANSSHELLIINLARRKAALAKIRLPSHLDGQNMLQAMQLMQRIYLLVYLKKHEARDGVRHRTHGAALQLNILATTRQPTNDKSLYPTTCQTDSPKPSPTLPTPPPPILKLR